MVSADRRVGPRASVSPERQSDRRLRRALAAAEAGVWRSRTDGDGIELSVEMLRILGMEPREGSMAPAILQSMLGDAERAHLEEAVASALAADGRLRTDVRIVRADGEVRWLRLSGDIERDRLGTARQAIGIASDVTPEKRLEQRLRVADTVSRILATATSLDDAAPRVLAAIAEGTGMEICGLWIPESDGRLLGCAHLHATDGSRARFADFIERSLQTRLAPGEGLVGRVWQDRRAVWVESVASIGGFEGQRASFVDGLQSGVAIPLSSGLAQLGVIDVFSSRAAPSDPLLLDTLAGLGNEFAQFILRMRAEAALRQSDEAQRLLVRVMQDHRETHDPERMMHDAATALGEHLGADRVGFIRLVDDDRLEFLSSWVRPGTTPIEGSWSAADIGAGYLARIRDGQAVAVRDMAIDPLTVDSVFSQHGVRAGIGAPIMRSGRWSAGLYVHQALPRDWSPIEVRLVREVADQTWDAVERAWAEAGRRAAAEALRSSEERFRATFENAAVGVGHVAPDGRWLRVNDKLCQITGYSEAELLERRFQDITHPDDLAGDEAQVERTLAGQIGTYTLEKRYIRKDGRPVWVDLTVSLVRAPSGEAEYFIAVIVDISARKQAEARLHRALAAKDEFLGFVSHELRTPMTVILGMSQMLAADRLPPAQLQDVATDIAGSAHELNDLIESMLLLARLDSERELAAEPLLLARVAQEAVSRQRRRDRGRTYRLASADDSLVHAHAGLLDRVISNLLGNAAKYSLPDGDVEVIVETTDDEVSLRVLDAGPGLEEDELGRLFEPFFRASGSRGAPGLGLGLAVAQRIVDEVGGRIWAARRPEGGSEFGFALPRLEAREE